MSGEPWWVVHHVTSLRDFLAWLEESSMPTETYTEEAEKQKVWQNPRFLVFRVRSPYFLVHSKSRKIKTT